MNFIIDKTNWKKVKLNDVCEWYQKNIPNHNQMDFGIKYYVTANHIDSDSTKFKRFNELSDGQKGPTITKHFEKGDLLLSTRSVALRKASIAPVDGVTGEKLLVLRTKENSGLLEELMPYVFQSIDFWGYAQNSASGSVNKFTSWTKIREYEFLLPPKDQQAQLAKLLWALDNVIEKEKNVLETYLLFKQSKIKELYFGDNLSYDKLSLGEITEVITKGTTPSSIGESFKTEGINYLKIESLTSDGDFIEEKFEHIDSITHNKLKRSQLKPNDILFSIAGALGRSTIVPEQICPANTNQALALIRLIEGVEPYYILEFLKSDFIKYHIERVHVKGAQPNLSLKNVNEIEIPLPEFKIQKNVATEVNGLNQILNEIKTKVASSEGFQKSLINQIF